LPRSTPQGVAGLALAALVLVPLGRVASYGLVRVLRKRRVLADRALIIGAGEVGTTLARILEEHPGYGLCPAGFLDPDPRGDVSGLVVADPSALASVVRDLRITHIIVTFSTISDAELVRILRGCATLRVAVHVVPRLFELGVAAFGPAVDDVWGVPLVRARRPAPRGPLRRTKRVFDLVVGSALLLLSAPVFALATAAVRLSSPGPVFFRQERIGQDGRPFRMLKFRTLLCNDDSDRTWCVDTDDRRTRVGLFLRKTGLDELPQILNVLRGEMSLIGPRPERPYFAALFSREMPRYGDRHRVPQGITGWAQIHDLRGNTSISDRIRFDDYYIENRTIWLDIWILIRTVGCVLRKRGA
jgi:exopolysaccharide biosynthesis polyprenyl glycosylphosphotransferase